MIEQYLSYLTNVIGVSTHTVLAYENDLTSFCKWLRSVYTNPRWSNVSQQDIEAYIAFLSKTGYTPASSNRHLSSIKGIYRYFIREGLLRENPAARVLFRKDVQKLPVIINVDIIHEAYINADADTRLMIGLLYTTGIRVEELLGIEWDDIELINIKSQEINAKAGQIRIKGKGLKERYVYIGRGLVDQLDEKRRNTPNSPLHGRIWEYGQRTVRRMIEIAFRNIGYEGQISPHILRHTIATQWAVDGANNATIAKALGHSRLETSQKYINMGQLDVKQLMNNNNNLFI